MNSEVASNLDDTFIPYKSPRNMLTFNYELESRPEYASGSMGLQFNSNLQQKHSTLNKEAEDISIYKSLTALKPHNI